MDARAARTYRDELDALRERAIKADKLESEVGRYREQLHKMEFYKAKVEVGAVLVFYTVTFFYINFDEICFETKEISIYSDATVT